MKAYDEFTPQERENLRDCFAVEANTYWLDLVKNYGICYTATPDTIALILKGEQE